MAGGEDGTQIHTGRSYYLTGDDVVGSGLGSYLDLMLLLLLVKHTLRQLPYAFRDPCVLLIVQITFIRITL